jgi:hypothetical protein
MKKELLKKLNKKTLLMFFYLKNYYPGDYFDFSDGKPLGETTINIWIQQMFDAIAIKAKDCPGRNDFAKHMSTGNTKIVMEAYRQNDKNKFTVYVSVCTDYKQKSAIDIEF